MTGILDGLRIVEGSAFIAAPSAGMSMAQLGADVIRFDLPGGGIDYHRWPVTKDNTSLYWAGLNKGKRSIAVDFRKPEGRELLTALITAPGEDAGIVLTNFPMTGWLAYESLREKRADLIAINLIGNPDGSVAVDYTVNAAVGYPEVTGPAGQPTNHVFPGWDIAAGMTLATGLLAAERHRRRTGEGQLVRLSLADVAVATVANLGHVADWQVNRHERPNVGNDVWGTWGRDFATADGRRVMVVAVSTAQWRKLIEATGVAEAIAAIEAQHGCDLALEEMRYEHRAAINGLIADWCGRHALAEIRSVLEAHNVCWGPYQSFRQLVEDDPRCSTANPLFGEIDQPGIGRYLVPRSPLAFGAVPRAEPRVAPRLGEHTDEVLTSVLGLSDGELGRLRDAGVIAGSEG
jgi:2-methylfumaryl-CoA isomerase